MKNNPTMENEIPKTIFGFPVIESKAVEDVMKDRVLMLGSFNEYAHQLFRVNLELTVVEGKLVLKRSPGSKAK